MPPEIAVVPPTYAARSSTVTSAPWRAAASAAASAAAPLPTTITCSLIVPARSFAQPLPHQCEQLLVLHLRAAAVHRDLVVVEEQHAHRDLVARQPLAQEGLDLVLTRRGV